MAFSFVAVSIPTVADKLDKIAKFSRDEWKTLGLRSLNQAIPKGSVLMACAQTVEEIAPLFDYCRWNSQLAKLSTQYAANTPLPHVLLEDFLDADLAGAIAQEFPRAHTEAWTQYKHHNENKLGMAKRELFPSRLGSVTDELNSPRFVAWLSQLTGIPNLIADPGLEGGGLHQSSRGGFLNLHTDFSHHHYHKNWRRRVNIILYLNEAWESAWGGAIEFWDSGMRQCFSKYPPHLNHAVIFNTDDRCFHGFPEPLTCPEGETRKSLAFYYYTVEQDSKIAPHSTNYRARPTDSIAESAMIWLDKTAVDLYSRAKVRFGFSDKWASKVLGVISRKK
jgi:Rps23 Pro-64 3,4-dihydroxylase Tpa1-like proline 4-hydroxylase